MAPILYSLIRKRKRIFLLVYPKQHQYINQNLKWNFFMHKWIASCCLTGLIIPSLVFANIRPMMSFSLGMDHTKVNMNQTLTMIPPFQNSYVSNHPADDEPLV